MLLSGNLWRMGCCSASKSFSNSVVISTSSDLNVIFLSSYISLCKHIIPVACDTL